MNDSDNLGSGCVLSIGLFVLPFFVIGPIANSLIAQGSNWSAVFCLLFVVAIVIANVGARLSKDTAFGCIGMGVGIMLATLFWGFSTYVSQNPITFPVPPTNLLSTPTSSPADVLDRIQYAVSAVALVLGAVFYFGKDHEAVISLYVEWFVRIFGWRDWFTHYFVSFSNPHVGSLAISEHFHATGFRIAEHEVARLPNGNHILNVSSFVGILYLLLMASTTLGIFWGAKFWAAIMSSILVWSNLIQEWMSLRQWFLDRTWLLVISGILTCLFALMAADAWPTIYIRSSPNFRRVFQTLALIVFSPIFISFTEHLFFPVFMVSFLMIISRLILLPLSLGFWIRDKRGLPAGEGLKIAGVLTALVGTAIGFIATYF